MTKKLKRISPVSIFVIAGVFLLLSRMPGFERIRQNRMNLNLLRAVYHNDVVTSASLLQQGADANTKDDNPIVNAMDRISNDGEVVSGHTLLMLACSDENAPLVQLLLQHGADINRRDDQGTTALMWAVMVQNSKVVVLLLEKGAGVNDADSKGFTALMQAARRGDLVIAQQLLKRGAVVTACDKQGHTAQAWAIHNGYPQVSMLLKQAGDKK